MGYVLNDNTASGGVKFETDTVSCSHCRRVLHKSHWTRQGGWCHACCKPICDPCAEKMLTRGCEPFLKKIEGAYEDSQRLTRLGIRT